MLISFKLIKFSNSFSFLKKLGCRSFSKSQKEAKHSDQTFSLNTIQVVNYTNFQGNKFLNKIGLNKTSKEKKLRRFTCDSVKTTELVKRNNIKPDQNIRRISLDVDKKLVKINSSIQNTSLVSSGPKIRFKDINSAEEVVFNNILNKNLKKNISNASNRIQSYARTVKVLFVISTTFLLLNCPMTINKFWYFFKYHGTSFYETNLEEHKITNTNQTMPFLSYRPLQISSSGMFYSFESNGTVFNMSLGADVISSNESFGNEFNMTYSYDKEKHDKSDTDPLEEIFERISCYLYYLNFSLNFFLYSTTGSKFRNAFISMFRKETLENRRFSSSIIKSNRYDNTQLSTTLHFNRNLV